MIRQTLLAKGRSHPLTKMYFERPAANNPSHNVPSSHDLKQMMASTAATTSFEGTPISDPKNVPNHDAGLTKSWVRYKTTRKPFDKVQSRPMPQRFEKFLLETGINLQDVGLSGLPLLVQYRDYLIESGLVKSAGTLLSAAKLFLTQCRGLLADQKQYNQLVASVKKLKKNCGLEPSKAQPITMGDIDRIKALSPKERDIVYFLLSAGSRMISFEKPGATASVKHAAKADSVLTLSVPESCSKNGDSYRCKISAGKALCLRWKAWINEHKPEEKREQIKDVLEKMGKTRHSFRRTTALATAIVANSRKIRLLTRRKIASISMHFGWRVPKAPESSEFWNYVADVSRYQKDDLLPISLKAAEDLLAQF